MKNNIYKKIYKKNFSIILFLFVVLLIGMTTVYRYYKTYNLSKIEKEKVSKLKISFQDNDESFDNICDNDNQKIDEEFNNNTYKKVSNNNSKDNLPTTRDIDNDNSEDADCIIEIPEINLSKIVYTGNNRDAHLSNYELITAAPDMHYKSGGNYIICGHASRLYGHSLNRLKEVHKGTLIQIWANKSLDEFEVNKVYFENMDNTSKYCKQTSVNEITIVSCAKYVSVNSYIVIKATKK